MRNNTYRLKKIVPCPKNTDMKSTIIFLIALGIALFLSPCASGQINDSAYNAEMKTLNATIIKLNSDITDINSRLNASHKRFKTGTALTAAGLFVSVVGGIISSYGYYDKNNNTVILGGAFAGAGLVAGITGMIIHIDSHKLLVRKKR